MPYNLESQVALIGAGGMAIEYAKVLTAQSIDFVTIGRGQQACDRFSVATGAQALPGGLETFADQGLRLPESAIVAVGIQELASVCEYLLSHGVRRVLLEKPGGNSLREIESIASIASLGGANVYLAYNRRFYSSTRKAREIIAGDGGLTSLTFEFTEWSHEIEILPTAPAVKRNWFMANSTHVCDLAFFLGGLPARLHAEAAGALSWYPSGAIFTGSGVTDKGALFSYHANWDSAGRWGVELCTNARRLTLRPMERLFETRRGSVAMEEIPLADELDKRFKPGLYRQVEAFFNNWTSDLVSVAYQAKMARDVYARICPSPA